MATIHNAADFGQIAPAVLMPGDPKRAQYIAMNFLENPQLVSDVRGILCYTGTYEGKPVTVMGSGMGQGSIGIYSYELFNEYDVQRIIRVGTAGGLHPSLHLRDLVLGLSASTDSNFAAQYQMPGTFNPCCSFNLAQKAWEAGKELGLNIAPGMLFSGAAFHYPEGFLERWRDMGALAVEMETTALYMNAMKAGKEALTICTITDMIFTGEACTVEERQTCLNNMITVALKAATR